MAAHYTAKLVGERSWQDNANGVRTGVTRTYQVLLGSNPAGTYADEIDPTDVSGLPQPGSSYSSDLPDLYVSGYSWTGSNGNERRKVLCTVTYTLAASEASEANKAPRGQDIQDVGWRTGSISRDLVRDAITGNLLKNTAGQPFDSVPQVEIPSPVWCKTVKTVTRKDWRTFYGKINAAQMTLGGEEFAAKTVRCIQCDEKRLWNDEFGYAYEYTVGFQVMTNEVKVAGAQQATEIGWNLAFVSAGTMELNRYGELVPIKTIDEETKKEVFVQSPVLLDANGAAMLDDDVEPFAIEVAAYKTATFPDAMITETPTFRRQITNNSNT